jgi:hypothetical protein
MYDAAATTKVRWTHSSRLTSPKRYISKWRHAIFEGNDMLRVWRQLSQPYTPYSIETKDVITSKADRNVTQTYKLTD